MLYNNEKPIIHNKKYLSDNLNINFDIIEFDFSKYDILVFLNGFTCSNEEWKEVAELLTHPHFGGNIKFNMIFIDIPGFGKSDSPNDISFYTQDTLINLLFQIIWEISFNQEKTLEQKKLDGLFNPKSLDKNKLNIKTNFNNPLIFDIKKSLNIILVGYSMGGRLALSFAKNYSHLLKGLILESASPGIENSNERIARIENDNKLIEMIKSQTVEEFIDYWMNQELFQTQKKLPVKKLEEIRKIKIENNNKTGLINSLLGFGTGQMDSLWNDLHQIKCRTLLITGELDEKYTIINRRMNELIDSSTHSIIKNAGHNVHLENPNDFVNLIFNFFKINS